MSTAVQDPIFIFGSKRGGTTLLRMVLNGHPELHIPNESHFLLPIINHKYNDLNALSDEEIDFILSSVLSGGRFDTWKTSLTEIQQLLYNHIGTSPSLKQLLNEIFTYEVSKYNKVIWGDKTPEYTSQLDQFHEKLAPIQGILIVRDGRDVAKSLKNNGWEGWTVYQRAKYWRTDIRKMIQTQSMGTSRWHLLKYEDLVSKPANTVKNTCDFLGIQFKSEMLNFVDRVSDNITDREKLSGVHEKLLRVPNVETDIYKWKNSQSRRAIFCFESVAWKELRAMSYELNQFAPNNPLHRIIGWTYAVYGHFMSKIYNIYHNGRSRIGQSNKHSMKVHNIVRNVIRET